MNTLLFSLVIVRMKSERLPFGASSRRLSPVDKERNAMPDFDKEPFFMGVLKTKMNMHC
jgi:hypothetical protein